MSNTSNLVNLLIKSFPDNLGKQLKLAALGRGVALRELVISLLEMGVGNGGMQNRGSEVQPSQVQRRVVQKVRGGPVGDAQTDGKPQGEAQGGKETRTRVRKGSLNHGSESGDAMNSPEASLAARGDVSGAPESSPSKTSKQLTAEKFMALTPSERLRAQREGRF